MGSSAPDAALPALATSPRFIFFTDFDGTITQEDSNDFMTDNLGYGAELRKKGNTDVLHGTRTFRDSFREMLDSVHAPFDECIETLLANIKLDVGFRAFFNWTKTANVPVVILSGGMEPIIRALLVKLLGEEDVGRIQIVSNDVAPRDREGRSINEKIGWQIVFHDESHFGHDKSLEIRKYSQLPDAQRPVLFYAGDGVSDLSAAKETDLMFAKAGRDLVTYCKNEKIPYNVFEDFSDIHKTVQAIVEGKVGVKEAAENVQ